MVYPITKSMERNSYHVEDLHSLSQGLIHTADTRSNRTKAEKEPWFDDYTRADYATKMAPFGDLYNAEVRENSPWPSIAIAPPLRLAHGPIMELCGDAFEMTRNYFWSAWSGIY